MSLKFLRIEDAGVLESERVVFQAATDISIGKYLILQSRKSPDGKVFSGPIPAAYWLASINVKGGDLVILYSKAGQTSQKGADVGGATSYFFYWGLGQPIWTSNFKPTIITAATWEWTVS